MPTITERRRHKSLMSKLEIGESVFFPDLRPDQLTYIRRVGYSLGIKLSIRWTPDDEIYQTPGSRVLRRA